MPNIIINNYCNISCGYCFASANMQNKSLQKTMSMKTYLNILKYLKLNNDNNVRILGGEPLVHPKIKKFIQIAYDLNYDIIVFSNITVSPDKFEEIMRGFSGIRVNCNINQPQFYTKIQLENIYKNLSFMKKQHIYPILGYNIDNLDKNMDFLFDIGNEYGIYDINLKITNSSLDGKLLIENKSIKLGEYIYDSIKKNHGKFFFEISCGLDKNIFTQKHLDFFDSIDFFPKFGCDGNVGKFDINTDGNIFKCFPLVSLYKDNKYNIDYLIENKISIEENISNLYKEFGVTASCGECVSNSRIKNI